MVLSVFEIVPDQARRLRNSTLALRVLEAVAFALTVLRRQSGVQCRGDTCLDGVVGQLGSISRNQLLRRQSGIWHGESPSKTPLQLGGVEPE
jgi:hypothetical protein